MKTNNPIQTQLAQFLILSVAMTSGIVGCNRTAFKVLATEQPSTGPGFYSIPPKVDILLFVEDRGRMYPAWNSIQADIKGFLAELSQKNWDYHFAVTPLSSAQTLTNATASQQDINWGSLWTAPYPGATAENLSSQSLSSSAFMTPELYSQNLSGFFSSISNASMGQEPGIANVVSFAQNARFGSTQFLRKDALFIPFILTLGEDTSSVNFCDAPDSTPTYSHKVPCEWLGNPRCTSPALSATPSSPSCGSWRSSLEYFKSELKKKYQDLSAKVQLYTAAPAQDNVPCWNTRVNRSSRYTELAVSTGGQSFDICNNSTRTLFDLLVNQLTATRQTYQQRYLFLPSEPNPASIQITKYIGGDLKQAVVIPPSDWTYVGYVNQVPAIDAPVAMNIRSGYAIRLADDARITGNDTVSIRSTPAGAQDSVSR